jgi:hypothetical protein
MIVSVETWSIRDSIRSEIRRGAMEFMKKFVKCVREKWPEIQYEVLRNGDGSQNDIHFSSRHESISAHQQFVEMSWNDDEIKLLVDELEKMERSTGNTFFFNRRTHYYHIVDLD